MVGRIARSFVLCAIVLCILSLIIIFNGTAKTNALPKIPLKPHKTTLTETAVNSMKSTTAYGYTTTRSRFSREQILLTLRQYSDFDKLLDRACSFTIPGLENTFAGKDCQSMVPQGICMTEKYFLTTAYDADSSCGSVIYAISNDSERKLKCVIGLPVKIHAGGITSDGENIWICGDDEITADSRAGIMYSVSAELIDSLINSSNHFALIDETALTRYNISNSASFCTYYKNRLWVGTFTNISPQESTFGCIMSYDINSAKHLNGENFLNFDSFILLPNRSQGVCFVEQNDETYMLLSRSFARNSHVGKDSFISEIRVYKPTFDPKYPEKLTRKGNAISVLNTPPMIEELCFDSITNRLYAIFESGASKYSTDSKSQLRRCQYIFDKIAALDIEQLIG